MGNWRGPRTPRDPLLNTPQHRANRRHWLKLRRPCARCGQPIDYDGPRYLLVNGRRRLNPRALVVGHIVDRWTAKRLGWTAAQINALTNTQPECQHCSNVSGARLGNQVQRSKTQATPRITRTW